MSTYKKKHMCKLLSCALPVFRGYDVKNIKAMIRKYCDTLDKTGKHIVPVGNMWRNGQQLYLLTRDASCVAEKGRQWADEVRDGKRQEGGS